MSDEWLEVRTAISPIDFFFNRIHFIALSIKSLGERYTNTLIRVAVGADEEPYDLHKRLPWSRELGIEWYWVDRSDFIAWKNSANAYLATIVARFQPPFMARYVLVLDPDVIAMAPFDDLINMIEVAPAVAGVMAHTSPFISNNPSDHKRLWKSLYRAVGLIEPKFELQHSGWGIYDTNTERRFSPPYLNSGVILAPSDMLKEIWPAYLDGLKAVTSVIDTYYYDQIGFTLALAKLGLPYHCVPLRYNFPNEPIFDNTFTMELADIRFLHFLRTTIIDRDSAFRNFTTIANLINRTDLTGSNEVFRQRISQLFPLVIGAQGNEATGWGQVSPPILNF